METGGEAAEVATAEAAAAEAMAEETVAAEKEAAAGAGEVEDAAVEKGAAEEEGAVEKEEGAAERGGGAVDVVPPEARDVLESSEMSVSSFCSMRSALCSSVMMRLAQTCSASGELPPPSPLCPGLPHLPKPARPAGFGRWLASREAKRGQRASH